MEYLQPAILARPIGPHDEATPYEFSKNPDRRWQAVVIGAGPAGSLTAHELARRGLRVLLVDRKPFGRGKVCGACVNGRALAVLEDLGLAHVAREAHGVPLTSLHVRSSRRAATIRLPAGIAVSRARFDAVLVSAALAAGAEFLPETTAFVGTAGAATRTVRLRGAARALDVRADVVIAADGLSHPSLAMLPEFRCQKRSGGRIGGGCVLGAAPDSFIRGTVYMAVGRFGYVGFVRIDDDSLNVAAAIDPKYVRVSGGLAKAAQAIVCEAGLRQPSMVKNGRWSGTPPLTHRPKTIAARRLFVIGDAAGYVEPFTGEGIAWALKSAAAVAPLVAEAVAHWRDEIASTWMSVHRRQIVRRQRLCRALATLLRYPRIVHCGLDLLTWMPGLVERVVDRLNGPAVFLGDPDYGHGYCRNRLGVASPPH
jgi:flavin-dependent dehydrogenase